MPRFGELFDRNAGGYQRFRPGYPIGVRDRIAERTSLQLGGSILEIGCGTGQATGFFENFQPRQVCVDPGRHLVTECRRRFPAYEFVCCRFEDFEGAAAAFDLIYAATSFHWLDRAVRFQKSAHLLRHGGHLAVLTDRHTKNLGGFFAEVSEVYAKLAPDMFSPFADADGRQPEENPLDLVDEFELDRDLLYSADEYIGLLGTFSGHIALGEARLSELCRAIHTLIEARYEGRVAKTLTTYVSIYRHA